MSETDGKGIKGGLISEDIFTLVPSSKNCAKSLSSTYQPKLKELLIIVIFFHFVKDRTKVKIPSKRNSPLLSKLWYGIKQVFLLSYFFKKVYVRRLCMDGWFLVVNFAYHCTLLRTYVIFSTSLFITFKWRTSSL